VPLTFRFEIYHYGPFSQEIFEVTEDLLVDDVIRDDSNVPGKSRYVPADNCDTVLKLCEGQVEKYRAKLDEIVDILLKCKSGSA